jgi:hypothetical protein
VGFTLLLDLHHTLQTNLADATGSPIMHLLRDQHLFVAARQTIRQLVMTKYNVAICFLTYQLGMIRHEAGPEQQLSGLHCFMMLVRFIARSSTTRPHFPNA